ncbi:MAG TPA: hypothetical protein VMU81_24540 [Acetobacteraceae bacterium]|nr:hypothetical protein [Acetobacteraceae bacterium]
MRKFTRIQDGRVAEIFLHNSDISSMFHPALVWVDASSANSDIAEGWIYDGKEFLPPPPRQSEPPPMMIDNIHKQLIALIAQVEAIKQSGNSARITA